MSLLDLRSLVEGTGATAYTLNCDAGSYTYTGQVATFAVTRALSCDAGAYTYTGKAATFGATRALAGEAGSYAYDGKAASFAYSAITPVEPTTVAGGGRKRKSKKYPRRIMVRGILYTVRSLEEEMALVQAMLDRAEYQDAVSVEPATAEPVKALRRRLKRVESEHQKWLVKLRAADEEILLLLH